MRVTQFTDEYESIAPLYDMAPDGLRARDRMQSGGIERWIAKDGDRVVGAASVSLRPDRRRYIRFQSDDEAVLAPLANAIAAATEEPLWTSCDGEPALSALADAGFEVVATEGRYDIPLTSALGVVRRAWVPSEYTIESIADLDQDRVFDLDNQLRRLVPGLEGWEGDRKLFDDEVASDAFDPDAYVIAVHRTTREYVGLLRIWRNDYGPRLGMIAVLPDHRRSSLAAAMLRRGLEEASTWGSDSIRTETSLSNSDTQPLLERLGIEPVGVTYEMMRA